MIKQILNNLKIKTTQVEELEAPQLVSYYVKLGDIADAQKVKRNLLNLSSAYGSQAYFNPISNLKGFHCVISFAKSKPSILANKRLNCDQLLLGVDTMNNPIEWEQETDAHLLIAGSTGTGKTIAIKNVITQLINQNRQIILIDTKNFDFKNYNNISNFKKITNTYDALVELHELTQELDYRYKSNLTQFEPIYLVVDELADLMLTSNQQVEPLIVRLAQLGRACNIHLILATQRPMAKVVTGLLKVNLTARLIFKVASYVDSMSCLDRRGAEQLKGKGDAFFMSTAHYSPIRLQGYFTDEATEQETIANNQAANPEPTKQPEQPTLTKKEKRAYLWGCFTEPIKNLFKNPFKA